MGISCWRWEKKIDEATTEDGVAVTGDRSGGGRALYSEDARNSFSVALVFPSFERYFLSAE